MTTELAEKLRELLAKIVDCYGVGSTPEQFCRNVAEFMEEACVLLASLSPDPAPGVDKDLTRALRSALRFAASRNAITADEEKALLAGAGEEREDFYAGRYAERCGDVAMRDVEIKELRTALTKAMRELGNAVEIDPGMRQLVDYDECLKIAKAAIDQCQHMGGSDG